MRKCKKLKENKTIKIVKMIIILTILFLLFFILDNKIKEENIKFEKEEYIGENYNNVTIENSAQDEIKKTDIVIKKYEGYDVIARLTIPKIDVDTYVLSMYTDKALKTSVTKFCGPNPNEIR